MAHHPARPNRTSTSDLAPSSAADVAGKAQQHQGGGGLNAGRVLGCATAPVFTRRIFCPGKKGNQSMSEQKSKRGGAHPGAGRPKGAVDKRFMQQPEQGATYEGVQTPLEYMLAVMRDPLADFRRRDDMAKAAAPYCHEKKTSDAKPAGKKEQAEAAAQSAGKGSNGKPICSSSRRRQRTISKCASPAAEFCSK